MAYGDEPKYVDKHGEVAILASVYKFGTEALIKTEDFGLTSKDFFYETNGNLFFVMQKILEENASASIDKFAILTKAKALGFEKFRSNINNSQFIETISEYNISLSNTYTLCESVKKNAVFRKVSERLSDFLRNFDSKVNGGTSFDELLFLIEGECRELTDSVVNPNAKFEKIGNDIEEWVDGIANNPTAFSGVPSGFNRYDEAIGGGFLRGSVNMVGARTGVGKSFFGACVSNHVVSNNIPVLVIDTEMERKDHFPRIVSMRSNVSINDIKKGRFANNPKDFDRVKKEASKFKEMPYYHQYVGGWNFAEIIAYAKKWLRQVVGYNEDGTIKDCLIIYDYMKLMSTADVSGNLKEYQAIGFMMHVLHDFAKINDVPVLLFIQLNRDGISNESQGVAAQSDRTEWLATSFTILKNKTEDEIAESGANGNAKLITVKSRFGSGTPDGDYINLYKNLRYAKMTEGEFASIARKNNANEERKN